MSIEAVLQPRFHYAMNYFSFDAEVLFAFFAFGDTFFTLGLMVHIGLCSDWRHLAGFSGLFRDLVRNKFLSVTAALPLDDIGIFLNHFGSTLDLCTPSRTSRYQKETMCTNEILA